MAVDPLVSTVGAELLAALVRTSPMGLVAVDASGTVVLVNDTARRMFGRAFLGSHISTCADKYEILREDGSRCAPDDIPLARAAMFGETVVDRPCAVRRPDGTTTNVLASAQPLTGDRGERLGAILVLRDVSSEQAAERARLLERSRFEALALSTAQMVWTAHSDGRVVEDSPSWRAFTGQSWEQFRDFGWLDAVHPDDREATRRTWLTAVEAGSGTRSSIGFFITPATTAGPPPAERRFATSRERSANGWGATGTCIR